MAVLMMKSVMEITVLKLNKRTSHSQRSLWALTLGLLGLLCVTIIAGVPDAEAKRKRRNKRKNKGSSSFSDATTPEEKRKRKRAKPKSKSWIYAEAEFELDALYYHGAQGEFDRGTIDSRTALIGLGYQVEPIVLAGLKADLGLNLFGLERLIGTRFEYKGDWVYQSGGSFNNDGDAIQTLSQGNKNLSEVLAFIVDTYGLETRYRNAHFDFGSFDVKSALTNQSIAQGSFELDLTQVDIFYNFAWKMINDKSRTPEEREAARSWKRLTAGMRYMRYAIPRMVKPAPEAGGLPVGSIQIITQQAYMFGAELSFIDRNPRKRFGFGIGTGLYMGAGPVTYFDKQGKRKTETMIMGDVPLEVTIRFNLLPSDNGMIFDLDASYYVQYITYTLDSPTGASGPQDTLEGSDFFHGPRVRAVFRY